MFDRNKKDDAAMDAPEAGRAESEKTFGSLRTKASSGRGDAAVIGRSIQINGDLRGGEDLRIEGDVTGTVELRNSVLTIGKEGKVKADVYAKEIAVDGETKGDLYAAERITVHVNARVQGNIIAPRVSIEEGAHFKGSIEMDPAAVDKALGKTVAGDVDNKAAKRQPSGTDDSKSSPGKSSKDAAANLNPPTGNA